LKPEILLDVMYEDLLEILIDKGWNAKTVTRELGASTEARADDNIFKYAQKTRCVLVTVDRKFVQRFRAEGLVVITIDAVDKADIVDKKLKEKLEE
jgi:rRNA-processing protein FCF1